MVSFIHFVLKGGKLNEKNEFTQLHKLCLSNSIQIIFIIQIQPLGMRITTSIHLKKKTVTNNAHGEIYRGTILTI